MSNVIVPNNRTGVRERAVTATLAMNPALVAYIVFMVCLTAAVVF